MATMGRVVVFGGNGFVGAEVLRALVKRGVPAVSVSRGGLAPKQTADFATEVEWVAGDALKPDSYRSILEGASAVVVAVGSPPLPFVNYGYQVNANGATNEKVLEAAFAANVRRAVVIGATMPQWCPKGAPYTRGAKELFCEGQKSVGSPRSAAKAIRRRLQGRQELRRGGREGP
jgi:nucleoside-diphosphate-sugar epimerase